jgi:hypothetical protein
MPPESFEIRRRFAKQQRRIPHHADSHVALAAKKPAGFVRDVIVI